MEQNIKKINYKVLQQIDIYKNNNFSDEKSLSRDQYIENKIANEITNKTVLSLLSDDHEYNVIFPKQTTYYQNFNNSKVIVENLRKIGLRIKSIQKILNLAGIDESEILMYLLFYHTTINLETSTENLATYNINYDTLMKIAKYFNVKSKKDDIHLNKNSLKKIIEMCGLSYNERFRYMNFYEVEEKTIKTYNGEENIIIKKNSKKIIPSVENKNKNKKETTNENENKNENEKEGKIKLKSNKKYKIDKKDIDKNDIDKNSLDEIIEKNGIISNGINKNGINKISIDKNSINKSKESTKLKSSNKSLRKNSSKIKKNKKSKDKDKVKKNNKNENENEKEINTSQKDILLQEALKDLNNNNTNNIFYYNLYNSKNKNKRYNLLNSLDFDDEEVFERSYEFLKTPRINNRYNQLSEKSIETPNISQIEDMNKGNNIMKSSNRTSLKKSKTCKKLKKRKKKPNLQIHHENTVSFLGSSTKSSYEIKTDKEFMYPFNGYTRISTSFAIESPEKQNTNIKSKKDNDDYCYYPFILRKMPELQNKILYLSGSLPKLGNWDPFRAIKMDEENRNGEEFFSKYIEVQKSEIPFEYKYFYYDNGKIVWIGLPYENYLTFPQYFESLRGLKKSHISIIDLNIRYINTIDGINIWDNRKNKLIELLLNKKADIFFFQEITRPQSDFIDRYLSSIYEFVGEYRDSTDAAEKCSICVNKLKYTINNHGQFWLSSTPYVPGSNDFGNFFPRICTWASLKQIAGISLLFMNVHLDHVNIDAHLSCVKVVMEEEKKIENKYKDIHFVFIAGCFYSNENDEDIKYIKSQGFTEVMFENTYHGFTGNAYNHWDYMFWKEINGNNIEFKEAHVMKKEGTIDESRKHYISDHFPIYAEFFLKNIK